MDNLYAQVLYDYNGSFADELSVISGEILQILYPIDADWVYAKSLINIQQDSGGILPVNHLRILKLPSFESNKVKLFLATENFGEESGDLYFTKGEIIICQNKIDNNWFFGNYLTDPSKKGIFPISHVAQIQINDDKNKIESTHLTQPVNETNKQEATVPRQAKALHSFELESTDSSYQYLKFIAGDYLIITSDLDENWFIGEKLNGDKGLIPSKYIEFLLEEPIVLNKTQKIYKEIIPEVKEPVNSVIIPQIEVKLDLEHNEPTIKNTKCCKLNFDFQPESEHELGCLKGEYLKIIQVNQDKSEWIEVENIYGKKGMVPLSFVSLIHESDPTIEKLFDNNFQRLRNKSMNEASFNSLNSFSHFNSVRLPDNKKRTKTETMPFKTQFENSTKMKSNDENNISRTSKMFEEKINQSKQETIMFELQRNRLYTRNKTPESQPSKSVSPVNKRSSLSVYRPPPDPPIKANIKDKRASYRPSIPPKPTQNNMKPNVVNTRPVIFNNELLNEIKNLESIIQKKHENITETTDQINQILIPINESKTLIKQEDNSNLENLKTNLSNMKNLFVDTAQNRQLAMAQINTVNEITNEKIEESMPEIENKFKKRQTERLMTIKELFNTEKDFLFELGLCYEVFVINCTEYPGNFNKNILFDDLKAVLNCSNKLVKNLEAELESSDDNVKIGLRLIEVAEYMKDVYAPYLQNHPNISSSIKNYEANSETNQFITNRLNLLKDQVKVANLQTLLIKPVQRIFKYPLFIKRIYENTDPNHIDYKNLEKASDVYTKMLEFINEYKRRRDLVKKYITPPTDLADLSISDIFKKIKLKTLAKKTTRLSVQLSTALGLFNQQVFDSDFEREEINFKLIEKCIRKFSNDLDEYLQCLEEMLKSEAITSTELLYIFTDEFQIFVAFETSAFKRLKEDFQKYNEQIKKSIMIPLRVLINNFNGPNKLIDKRNDKLVDYEAVLSDYKYRTSNGPILKEFEVRLEQTKGDYDALNNQLLDDLPKLTKLSNRIFITTVKYYLILTKNFYSAAKLDLRAQIEKSNIKSTINIPKLDITFQKQSSIFFNNENTSVNTITNKLQQTEEHKTILKTKYSTDNLFKVFKDYVADDNLRQLALNVNDIVGLIKPYDPANQKHIWLVDNGQQIGFIPCEVLESYVETNSIAQNLINFDDDYDLVKTELNPFNKSFNSRSSVNENVEKLFTLDAIEEYCIALFDFKAIKHNMIDLVEGKIYKLKEKCDKRGDGEWWLLESHENKIGYVPQSYVKLLD